MSYEYNGNFKSLVNCLLEVTCIILFKCSKRCFKHLFNSKISLRSVKIKIVLLTFFTYVGIPERMILRYRLHKNTLLSKNSIKYSLLTWYNEGGELDSQLCSIPDLWDSLCGPQNHPPTKWLICCLTAVSLQGPGLPVYIRALSVCILRS